MVELQSLTRSRKVLMGCLLLIAAFATAFATIQDLRKPSDLREPLRIAVVAYAGSCPILMAAREGYLADEGIAAHLEIVANGKASLKEVLEQRADVATAADLPITLAALADAPVSVLASMAAMEDHAILARRDRAIIVPADLKGKAIGVSLGTTTQFFLDALLTRSGLSPQDATEVDLAPSALSKAISTGKVDAAVLYEPFLTATAATLGDNAVIFRGQAVYDVVFALVASQEFVDRKPALAERLLRATLRGAQFCRERGEIARNELARIIGAEPQMMESIWPSYHFEVALRQALLLTLEDDARWAIKNGLSSKPAVPNFLDHLALDPLNVVAPRAVTVIR